MAKEIIIDGKSSICDSFRGLGCVTGNGSSRLLLDYKRIHPEQYQEIMNLLFLPDYGAGLTHIKIELGADVNSSSGTEPCTKRNEDEKPDVTRGAGFQFAADAKKINPDITIDLLRWGEPYWVTKAFSESQHSGFRARYQWYYETILAAYETYHLEFDFISPDVNETDQPDVDWLIYFSEKLKSEKHAPYDFSKIQIVASDEVGSIQIAKLMRENERLRNAVDVIGLHYTTYGDENTNYLHEFYHKEIWYSEGIAPCNVPALSRRVDDSGITGANGAINTAVRIINSYAHSCMNLYEFQPAVSGYYDGSCYAPKQLLTANTPWSGYYQPDIGIWISAHFMRFAKPGWQYMKEVCFGDGEENHTIWDTTDNYMTLISPDRSHLTMHFANDTDKTRNYKIIFRNLPELSETLSLIQTEGSAAPDPVDQNWFQVIRQMEIITDADKDISISVTVRPFSLLTLTTLDTSGICGTAQLKKIPEYQRLSLPFFMNFPENDSNPFYTTDQGGAFELIKSENGSLFLEQKITRPPTNWRFRSTPPPLTCFGEDTWSNYQASALVYFASPDPENYAGISMRYNSSVTNPESSECGLQLRLYANGIWQLRYMEEILKEDTTPDYLYEIGHRISIAAIGTLVFCFIDNHSVFEIQIQNRPFLRSGRMALHSAYEKNRFQDIKAERINFPIHAYIDRIDCLDDAVSYLETESSQWTLQNMTGYQFYHRTCAIGQEGSEMEIRFYGNSIFLLGKIDKAVMQFWIDDRLYSEKYTVCRSNYRECFFALEHLHTAWHTLRMKIIEGQIDFDAFEIPTEAAKPGISEKAKKAISVLPAAGAAAGIAAAFTVHKLRKKKKKKK